MKIIAQIADWLVFNQWTLGRLLGKENEGTPKFRRESVRFRDVEESGKQSRSAGILDGCTSKPSLIRCQRKCEMMFSESDLFVIVVCL